MIDINNYKKDRTVCKNCYNINKRKNNINNLPPNKNIENSDNKKKQKILITKVTTLIFQHMKIVLMLLSGPETLVKLITCSKYLKK